MTDKNNEINVDLTDMQEDAIAAELEADKPAEVVEDEIKLEEPTPSTDDKPAEEIPDVKPDEMVEEKDETEPKDEVVEPENNVEHPDDVVENKEEEVEEQPVEEKPEEEKEPVQEENEIDKIKAELEEVKAIRDEEKSIRDFETQMQADAMYMDNVRGHIAEQLTRALKDIGVDLNTTMEELEKTNPDKAARARQFLEEAHRIEAYEQQKREQARNERLQEIVFKRAGRLFDKYKLTDEEGDVAAETFINILHEVGLKDLDDDLVAKVELAVGRTKLLVDRAKNVAKEVKDIAKEAADIVTDVMTPSPEVNPDEEKVKEELKAKDEAKEDKPELEPEPKIDVAAFEEGAAIGVQAPADPVDVLAELDKLTTTKERVAFYAEHSKEIEAALKNKYNK